MCGCFVSRCCAQKWTLLLAKCTIDERWWCSCGLAFWLSLVEHNSADAKIPVFTPHCMCFW